jgi:hypothetical protein
MEDMDFGIVIRQTQVIGQIVCPYNLQPSHPYEVESHKSLLKLDATVAQLDRSVELML